MYQVALMRIVRVVQIVYEFRILQKAQGFRELRLMANSIAGSSSTTIWSFCILGFACGSLGILFTEASLYYCIEQEALGAASTAQLRGLFGTPYLSSLTLYEAMSGGKDWGEVMDVLASLGWKYQCFFLAFQAVSFVVLLNTITAVFVESALQRSKMDQDYMVHTAMMAEKEFLITMQGLFHRMDHRSTGLIDRAELQEQLKDREIGAYFDSLGIDSSQSANLFHLLDNNDSGHIDEKEFMFGCIRLKGEARSLDLAVLHQEVKWLTEHITEGFMYLAEALFPAEGMDDSDCPSRRMSIDEEALHEIERIGSRNSTAESMMSWNDDLRSSLAGVARTSDVRFAENRHVSTVSGSSTHVDSSGLSSLGVSSTGIGPRGHQGSIFVTRRQGSGSEGGGSGHLPLGAPRASTFQASAARRVTWRPAEQALITSVEERST